MFEVGGDECLMRRPDARLDGADEVRGRDGRPARIRQLILPPKYFSIFRN